MGQAQEQQEADRRTSWPHLTTSYIVSDYAHHHADCHCACFLTDLLVSWSLLTYKTPLRTRDADCWPVLLLCRGIYRLPVLSTSRAVSADRQSSTS